MCSDIGDAPFSISNAGELLWKRHPIAIGFEMHINKTE